MLNNFLKELKRRKVYRVAITYAAVAWILLQVISVIVPMLEAPVWIGKTTLIFLLIGFPVVLILAWAYELSPEGLKRTTVNSEESGLNSQTSGKSKTSNLLIGFLILVIAGQFIYNRYLKSTLYGDHAEKSIAVLPFVNESSNMENQYFCNGVMEGILDHLAKIQNLIVLSRSSTEQFRDNRPSAKEIASKLNVEYLVEGSVQRIGDEAVIFAQLINAKEDKHLWSGRFKRNLFEVFVVQAEITESIAKELHTIIAPDLKNRIEKVVTTDALAYDYYLQGNEYLFIADSETQQNDIWKDFLSKAKLSFELALNRDSSFAEAMIGLAKVEYKKNVETEILSRDYLDKVISLSTKALSIDAELGEAYLLRSLAHYRNSRIKLAKKDLRNALIRNPNNIESLNLQLEIRRFIDLDFPAAIEIAKSIEKRASSESDLWQLYQSYWEMCFQIEAVNWVEFFSKKKKAIQPNRFSGMYWVLETLGRLEEAWLILNDEITQENQFGLLIRGEHFLHAGEFKKSVGYYNKWYEMVGQQSEDNWLSVNDWHRYGQALFMVGEEERGREMLEKQIEINLKKIELNRTGFSGLTPYYDLAGIYAFIGRKEEAYKWLNEFDKRDGWFKLGLLHHIKRDLQFNKLRSDQRFRDMIAKVEKRMEGYRVQIEGLMPYDIESE